LEVGSSQEEHGEVKPVSKSSYGDEEEKIKKSVKQSIDKVKRMK